MASHPDPPADVPLGAGVHASLVYGMVCMQLLRARAEGDFPGLPYRGRAYIPLVVHLTVLLGFPAGWIYSLTYCIYVCRRRCGFPRRAVVTASQVIAWVHNDINDIGTQGTRMGNMNWSGGVVFPRRKSDREKTTMR
jgi:hypothetical protein